MNGLATHAYTARPMRSRPPGQPAVASVSALIASMQRSCGLDESECAQLAMLAAGDVVSFGPREAIGREGDRLDQIIVVLEGWACRYRNLDAPRRQITAFMLPGDFSDHVCGGGHRLLDDIVALTPMVCARIDGDALAEAVDRYPRLRGGLATRAARELSIQREWTAGLGRRSAIERVGHLLCELRERLVAVGTEEDAALAMPLTQSDFADAAGLTSVHVNRVLQQLRAQGMIRLTNRSLTILDLYGLQRQSGFDRSYLYPAGLPRPLS